MKPMIKPEELLNYLRNKKYKENKARTELNNKNNNINISIQQTLNNLNIEPLQNYSYSHIDNGIYPKEKLINKDIERNFNKENINKSISNILTIKKFNYNENFFKLFKTNPTININKIKKILNIKKKKYNKGKDFTSFFLQPREDYYINTLNQGIINSFISFYSNAEKYYLNNNKINNSSQDNVDNSFDIHSLKIYNTKYPISSIQKLNNKEFNSSFNGSRYFKTNNIYEKCCNILNISNNNENIIQNNYFMQGLNHNIRYDLEDYLRDKIELLEINKNNDNNLEIFENKNFINKYPFQFIKVYNNKNIPIDSENIIVEKKLKYTFNKSRIMYPLFFNKMFDNTSIFKYCSYKNINIKNENNKEYLNLLFQKNIDKLHDLNNEKFGEEFKNIINPSDILNGQYLLNPFQLSINNKELIQKTNIIFKPKKLVKCGAIIFNNNKNKYKKKRTYLDLINNNNTIKNKKEDSKKLIIINRKNIGKLLNNSNEYILVDNISEGFDFLFDFNICGKMFYSSEFKDEFEYNGYNNLIDLINKNYLYYSKFYIFIADDEQLNKKEDYSVNKIVNTINKIINNKFSFIINNNIYQLNVIVKVISNPHLINYEINNIYNELVNNNFNNMFSVYNENIFNKVINDIKNNNKNDNDEEIIKIKNSTNNKFNRYENYILNMVQDINLKNEIKNIINNKYSKRNII